MNPNKLHYTTGGACADGDGIAPARAINYTFRPDSPFLADTDFIKRSQLCNVWLWRKFADQFRIAANDDERWLGQPNGWRGEYWGKMMRGAVLVCQYAEDEALHAILTDSVRDLLGTADAHGRISTYSREREFSGWDMWCRKYVLLGLEYYLEICRDDALAEQIIAALCRHADYILAHVGPAEEGKTPILETSHMHGGLNSSSILEPIVRLYSITGEQRYLDFAAYIVCEGGCKGENIFESAFADVKAPYEYAYVKAYEMMSCFEGLIEYARVTGDEHCREAAVRFGYKILETELSVIGCSGCTHEYFDNTARMQTKPPVELPSQETCVTVTWMKLCHQLLRLTGDPVFADALEQSFVNAYLGALNTHGITDRYDTKPLFPGETGTVTSYSPLTFDSYSPLTADTRGRKVAGLCAFRDDRSFYSCCACIGAAGIGIMGRSAVMETADGLSVQYYLDGRLQLTTRSGSEVVLNVETGYPYDGEVKITVERWDTDLASLRLRIPGWSAKTAVTICGSPTFAVAGTYMTVTREFAPDDCITLSFDRRLRRILPPYADGPDAGHYAAYAVGPVVLAKDARLGDYLHDPVSADVDADGYVPYTAVPAFSEIPDARLCVELRQTGGGSVRLIDYASAGKTYAADSACAAWLER